MTTQKTWKCTYYSVAKRGSKNKVAESGWLSQEPPLTQSTDGDTVIPWLYAVPFVKTTS